MKQKELNPKDFVLPSHIPHNEPGSRGMLQPVNLGWHKIKSLKPVDRPNPKKRFPIKNKKPGGMDV